MEKDTILYVLKKSEEYLSNHGIENPRLDTEVLLADMLGMERIRLYTNFDKKLNEKEKDVYRQRIKDRATHKPVAYIIRKKEFYKSAFYVDQNVLIPRPETEELLEWISNDLEKDTKYKVLDLGTGSGCIGVSLKKDFPELELVLSDISKEALDIAQKNCQEILGEVAGVSFVQSAFFDEFSSDWKFDKIVCNPPYIPIEEKGEVMLDVVEFEPHQALFLENPEEFYTKLLKDATQFLNPQSVFYLEIHPKWAEYISKKALGFGYKEAETKKDLSGKDRMLKLMFSA